MEGYVLSLVDNTHPAAPELLDDAVVRDGLVDHEGAQDSGAMLGVLRRRSQRGRQAGAAFFILWRDRAMPGYYTERLAAERLRACYDLAPPRTKAYLDAEIEFVLARTTPSMLALELGCGYGRVLGRLLPRVRVAFGIDTSPSSLHLALEYLGRKPSLCLACMDSVQMGFRDRSFDLTICVQNGICAFAVDQQQLFREAIRVTRSGGLVMFSSYTPQFWEHRLEWFEIQSTHHLIGEIDYQATGNGTIGCKDGFRTTTADRASFEKLAANLGVTPRITEVDGSSLFCEFVVP